VTQLNRKIFAAPVLAIALVLFLAGATSVLPVTPVTNGGQPTPEPTTAVPTPQQNLAASSGIFSLIFFIAGAILVCVFAVLLLFREKSLAKTLSE
jgi:hypothetical protein